MRDFDQQLLRLKQALGLTTDQEVAAALGMKKTAFSDRKARGAFPEDKVRALAGSNPELNLDVDHILTGRSDRKKELNRRLAILKTSTDKAQRLGLPGHYARAVQEILFFVEMENGQEIARVLSGLPGIAEPAPGDGPKKKP